MKKILIPIDGSEYSSRAVEKGREYAAALGFGIVLLHVSSIVLPISPDEGLAYVDYQQLEIDIKEEAESIFSAAKQTLGEVGAKAETVFENGDPADRIIKYAESNPEVDLVIMGSHGQGSLIQRVLIGSVTNKVLHAIRQPLLVVK